MQSQQHLNTSLKPDSILSDENYFAMTSEMNVINENKNADVFSSHILKLQ